MGGRGASVGFRASRCQRLALNGLAQDFAGIPECPPNVTVRRALQVVLGQDPGYVDDMASGVHKVYQRGMISLPRVEGGGVDLLGALPPHLRPLLEDETASPLLLRDLACTFKGKLAFDPRLARSEKEYGRFFGDLFAKGFLEYGESDSCVTPFFVARKDGRLRLIFDTRGANEGFAPPPYTALAGPQALANAELPSGQRLFKSQGDVECCFYQFGIPSWLARRFGLPTVPLGCLPPWLRRLAPKSSSSVAAFRLKVVPMGWSWAAFLIQSVMEDVLAKDCPERLLRQHRPAAGQLGEESSRIIYIDNFASLSTSKQQAQDDLKDMLSRLAARSIQAVAEDDDDPLLGFELDPDGREWRPTARKVWRIAFALKDLCWSQKRRTGRHISRALGHAASIYGLRPEMLAVFSHAYTFATKFGDRPARVWTSVRHEFRMAYALLPLAVAKLTRPWSPDLFATDASLYGMGVVQALVDVELIAATGRVSERCRFRGEMKSVRKPRAFVEYDLGPSDRDLVGMSAVQFLAVGAREGFPEVPRLLYEKPDWKVIAAKKWRRLEKILPLEAEAAVFLVRALGRVTRGRGVQVLALSDSMAWVCAATKGRSSTWSVGRRCRELCALSLALESKVVYLWIPSEYTLLTPRLDATTLARSILERDRSEDKKWTSGCLVQRCRKVMVVALVAFLLGCLAARFLEQQRQRQHALACQV